MTIPTYELEMQANEQRRILIDSLEELKSRARENFDVRKLIRRRPVLAFAMAAFFGLLAGYRTGNMVRPRKSKNWNRLFWPE